MRDWPKCMLVYQFQEGQNKELYHNSLPRGCHATCGHSTKWPLKWRLTSPAKCLRNDGPRGGRGGARREALQKPSSLLPLQKGGLSCLVLYPANSPPPPSQPKEKRAPLKPKEKTWDSRLWSSLLNPVRRRDLRPPPKRAQSCTK